MMSELNPQQAGRLKRLVAAEVLKQVFAKHNLTAIHVLLNGDDVEMFSLDSDRVNIFSPQNKIIGLVLDEKDDPDSVFVSLPDVNQFIRYNRQSDFVPEDHGIDPFDLELTVNWPIADIRKSLMKLAALPPPPPLKKAILKPIKVIGKMDDPK